MKMYLSKEFSFDSAHNLIHYHGKCEKLHGHTYRLKVTISGTPDAESGMILDFNEINDLVKNRVVEKLDHTYLNDIIAQSTAENMATWIWKELETPFSEKKVELVELMLWETPTSSVTLRKE